MSEANEKEKTKLHVSNFCAWCSKNNLLTYIDKCIGKNSCDNHKKLNETACRFSVSYKKKDPMKCAQVAKNGQMGGQKLKYVSCLELLISSFIVSHTLTDKYLIFFLL